ncbi:MAG: redoxin domain-containing protein [Planctomycetes bacterium]|nr:redoxin domain-containing protein [Planctomycetota bacterium]
MRDKNGRPVKGVTVASKPVCKQAVRTDADGRFEVSWYDRASIKKKFLLAQDIGQNLAGLVKFEDELQPVDIKLTPAFKLKGQVIEPNGKGIAGAAVHLRASLPGWITNAGERVFTDTNGYYQISAVPPPQSDFTYSIEVNAKDYGPQRLREITFGDDPAKPVDIETVFLPIANQSISGIVVDSNDEPAAGKQIFLRGPRGSSTAGQPERNSVTDKQGKFFIDGVCKGSLRIQAGTSSDPKGVGFIDAEGGDKDVKVILGQEGVHRPHVSLVDKPLLDLKDLKIEIPPAGTDDEMVLACFWDMEQRPSRNCIIRLARQAQQLKQKGVTVIAVQASKIDENTLNQWVKKYNIPFKVGMIQSDVEKSLFTWGVRSLPWLILTDRQNIVQAEGFSINELDERIAALREK